MDRKATFYLKRTKNIEFIKGLHSHIFRGEDFVNENRDNYYWFLLAPGDIPVGFCILTDVGDGIFFLSRAGILPVARGFGLQKRMIRVRERLAKKLGADKIITYTKIHNIKSSRNLQSCGYSLYIPEYEYADYDCLYWIKEA